MQAVCAKCSRLMCRAVVLFLVAECAQTTPMIAPLPGDPNFSIDGSVAFFKSGESNPTKPNPPTPAAEPHQQHAADATRTTGAPAPSRAGTPQSPRQERASKRAAQRQPTQHHAATGSRGHRASPARSPNRPHKYGGGGYPARAAPRHRTPAQGTGPAPHREPATPNTTRRACARPTAGSQPSGNNTGPPGTPPAPWQYLTGRQRTQRTRRPTTSPHGHTPLPRPTPPPPGPPTTGTPTPTASPGA